MNKNTKQQNSTTETRGLDEGLKETLGEIMLDQLYDKMARNGHEHVLRADAGSFAEQLRDPPEQRFLLFHGAGAEHGDLDVHDIGAPGDAVGIAICSNGRNVIPAAKGIRKVSYSIR
jgi:hypothetical protein